MALPQVVNTDAKHGAGALLLNRGKPSLLKSSCISILPAMVVHTRFTGSEFGEASYNPVYTHLYEHVAIWKEMSTSASY